MREIRSSGSEGGGTGSTGPPYPYHQIRAGRLPRFTPRQAHRNSRPAIMELRRCRGCPRALGARGIGGMSARCASSVVPQLRTCFLNGPTDRAILVFCGDDKSS